MLVSFARSTVLVVRAPLISDHGNQVRDWSSASTHAVPGCLVDSAAGAVDNQHRTEVRTDQVALMPPGSDVLITDHVRLAGFPNDFTIDSLQIQGSPTGALAQIIVGLNVWSG
jgi:hypothetical protein